MRRLDGLVIFTALLLSIPARSDSAESDAEMKARYGGGRLYSKNHYINNIVDELTDTYSRDRIIAGKRIKITIKDFSLEDEDTYAIVEAGAKGVEGPDRWWIIDLPVARKKIHGPYSNTLCVCRSYPLDRARKDLLAETREKGIVKRITVPQPPVPFGFEITGGSIGRIYLGQARDFAVHAYDDHHMKEVSSMVEGRAASALEVYEEDGALLLTAEIYNDRVFRVTTRSAKFKTRQGIGVGSTYAAARREYGPPAYAGQGDGGYEPVLKFQYISVGFGFAGVVSSGYPNDSDEIAVVTVAQAPK